MSPTRRDFLISSTAALASPRVLGANDRIQVGFIGYGLIGKQHVYDFKNQPDVDVAALCEVYQPRLEEGLAACGPRAKGYTDFRRLLDNQDIQAIVISTPDHWHALMAMMACAAGKDVYVEKPMTLFVNEGRWMVNAARRAHRIVQVGSQQRSGPHYEKAIGLMRNNQIGKIHTVRIGGFRNVMPGFGAPPDSDPPPGLDFDMWLGPAPARPYNKNRCIYHFRWFWDYSGGQMTNYGAHDVDIVHWAMNVNAPRAVSTSGGRFALEDNGETPDIQDAIFEYPGFTLEWALREASVGRGGGQGTEFFGTKGSLTVARTGFEIHPDMKTAPENLIPKTMGHPVGGPQLHPDDQRHPWTESLTERVPDDLWPRHARNFLDCIKSRQRPNADVEDGHRTVTACHLANLSMRLGRKIRWNAETEEIIGDAEASAHLKRPYRKPWDDVLRSLR